MNSRMGRMLAGFLLCQVGGYRAVSLIGDLTEEYARGRGSIWYWRQLLLAVLSSYRQHLRAHGMTFLGAIALGAGGVQACIALVQWLSELVWREELAIYGAALSTADLQSMELILFWGVWTPLTAVLYGLLGRLIAAFHSRHPKWVVASFICFILLSRLPWTIRLFLVDADDPRYFSYALQDLLATLLCAAGAWLGCIWHLRTTRRLHSINRMIPT